MSPNNVTEATLLSIRNTIANYCIALDTKNFSLLEKVFTPETKADYKAVSPKYPLIEGVGVFLERIAVILKGRITQHGLTTQRLEFEDDATVSGGKVCKAITYFTANTFTEGQSENGELDHVTVFGMYDDKLVEIEEGEWRIIERVVKTFHPRIQNRSKLATPPDYAKV